MNQENSVFGQSDVVPLSDEDASARILERAVTGLWDVVNELTRLRRTTRKNYRVTIFGAARLKPGTPADRARKSHRVARFAGEVAVAVATGAMRPIKLRPDAEAPRRGSKT
jgi:hypothetical protein